MNALRLSENAQLAKMDESNRMTVRSTN